MIFDMSDAENKLGYTFRNKDLLRNAFTHSSYINENPGSDSNEILEFFGDSILGFVVKEYLFKKFPGRREGELTTMCQSILSTEPLAAAVLRKGLNDVLLLGMGEIRNKDNHSICEDLFEACVAAVYLDGGLIPVRKFVFDALAPEIAAAEGKSQEIPVAASASSDTGKRQYSARKSFSMPRKLERPAAGTASADSSPSASEPERPNDIVSAVELSGTEAFATVTPMAVSRELSRPSAERSASGIGKLKDCKTRLSETVQKQGKRAAYVLEKRDGPDHEPSFTVRLEIDGKPVATGFGKSKKLAEMQAAELALPLL